MSDTMRTHRVESPVNPLVPVLAPAAIAERCLRCAAAMEWRHGTWQCPRCRFKLGCCEGPTAECFPDR